MDICKIRVQGQGPYTIYAKLAGRPKLCTVQKILLSNLCSVRKRHIRIHHDSFPPSSLADHYNACGKQG